VADAFFNYSDSYEVYEFMIRNIADDDEKVREVAAEWFTKAFGHDTLLPWLAKAYASAPFAVRRRFENLFHPFLPRLFHDRTYGYRFRLAWLTGGAR